MFKKINTTHFKTCFNISLTVKVFINWYLKKKIQKYSEQILSVDILEYCFHVVLLKTKAWNFIYSSCVKWVLSAQELLANRY